MGVKIIKKARHSPGSSQKPTVSTKFTHFASNTKKPGKTKKPKTMKKPLGKYSNYTIFKIYNEKCQKGVS